MSKWPSLGLELDTAELPAEVQQSLQARWQTESLGDSPLPLKVEVLDVLPASAAPAQAVEVSNSRVMVQLETVQLGQQESGETLWLDGLMRLRPLANGVLVQVQAGAWPQEAAWLLALAEAQRRAGWLPLHAATVAQPVATSGGEGAVSFSGVSGAGKSTAALRLMGLGYRVLAEDQTWFHAVSGQVVGLDRWLRTYPDSLERFAPQLAREGCSKDAYGKLMLPLPAQKPAALRELLFFGLPTAPSRADRVRAVWECAGVPLLPSTRQLSAQAVGQLLATISVSGTSREQVLEQVRAQLG